MPRHRWCMDTINCSHRAMTLDEFMASLDDEAVPVGIPELVRALWYDLKGDWRSAHEIAQEIESPEGALVHAYLHRKEGDSANARYWYSKACAPVPKCSLEEEWREIVERLLA